MKNIVRIIEQSTLAVFRQLAAGHVADGDLASKADRDKLVQIEFAARVAGYNFLTAAGVEAACALGLMPTRRPTSLCAGLDIEFESVENTGVDMVAGPLGYGELVQRRPACAMASFTLSNLERWPHFNAARVNGLWYIPATNRDRLQRDWEKMRRG